MASPDPYPTIGPVPAKESRAPSALAEALASVGDRWTLLVVAALLDEPRRFNDLLEAVPGIAPNILSARLRTLERDNLVVAEPYSTRPPRSLYELTAAGRELAGALRLLSDWGSRHSETGDGPRHSSCGSPLEPRWHCPTCGEAVELAADGDVEAPAADEEDLRFI
jgi:DNA-binding HxlR family transcriptional regulator